MKKLILVTTMLIILSSSFHRTEGSDSLGDICQQEAEGWFRYKAANNLGYVDATEEAKEFKKFRNVRRRAILASGSYDNLDRVIRAQMTFEHMRELNRALKTSG